MDPGDGKRRPRHRNFVEKAMTPVYPSSSRALFARSPFIGAGLLGVLLLPSGLPPLSAQEGEEPQRPWSFESEVGASMFFGASDQTSISTRLAADRKGSVFELDNRGSFLYGEATTEEGLTYVNKRSWEVGSNLSYRGFSRLNPYVFAKGLSSFERRIHRRYNAGAGGRVTVMDDRRSRLDFSLALLAERTLEEAGDGGDDELLARWTGRVRFRRSFSDARMVLSSEAEYNPVFDQFANFTVKSESSLSFALSRVVSLKLSLVDNYDSRAKDRGARSNNDGRLLFSVLGSF
jgi:hypothetical protein